ncbi:MAG: family 10 glycosylhydrolase [Planctomycetes bacterium]|nr:family 10 glycosylhydrolase [Planctomycetota bacterium]
MRRRTIALCLSLAVQAAAGANLARSQERPTPPAVAREFRAAWVATVNNIDWPSRPGLPAAAAQAELDAIVARAAALGLNALVFQVRPAGDAFYRSALEPWSEWLTGAQGRAPDVDWDPLAYAIERCHRRGLQLHAWCNPYRAWHPAAKSKPAATHVLSQLPDACVRYGSMRWMDPGDERAAEWSLAVLCDIVARYDVDGLHIDDYFYPYPEKGASFADDRSHARYRSGGGRLGLDDWRRANIDGFVERLYRSVHRIKPWVLVGISPFGIARPGVPRGIEAGVDQFADLYADVPKWLRAGWCDYLAPQLYWPIDQRPQSFAVLLPWWLAQNDRQRHVWPGLDAGRILQGKPPGRRDELTQQIALVRSAATRSPGQVLYSFAALRSDAAGVAGALQRLFREPALPPASPWLGAAAPREPTAKIELGDERHRLRWTTGDDVRFLTVQVRGADGWRLHAVVGAGLGSTELPVDAKEVVVRAVGRTGMLSEPVWPRW